MLIDLGLEHFKLHAQAAGFAAQQKFGVGKGQPVGVRVQGVALVGVGLEFRPGVGQATFRKVLCGLHGAIVNEPGPVHHEKRPSEFSKGPLAKPTQASKGPSAMR